MKNIYILCLILVLFCSGCSTVPASRAHPSWAKKMIKNAIPELTVEQKKVYARITFYHNHGDRFGSRIAMGGRAQQGITVAAHPDFKFGTLLDIPALRPLIGSEKFTVQDRGSAITSKKASHKKAYVFDIYINARSRREGEKLIKYYSMHLGDYCYVYIKGI